MVYRLNNHTQISTRTALRFGVLFVLFYAFTLIGFVLFGVFDSVRAEQLTDKTESTEEESSSRNDQHEVSEEEPDQDFAVDENVQTDTPPRVEQETAGAEESAEHEESTHTNPRIPAHISAPAIELDKNIVNPRSRDVDTLNEALLKGVTYYPRSGYLESDGNIFLFGHSSRLSFVRNENYRAFNRINELDPGDPIYLESNGTTHTYRVVRTYEAKDHEIIIDFKSDEPRLTLATCNVFGEKEDRYIVEAVLAEK